MAERPPVPVESVLARNTTRRVLVVGAAMAVLFGVLRGADGLVGALIGVAVVAGNFLLAGAMLSVAIRISLSLYHAAALFGFFVRLALITATVILIVQLFEIDRLAFGVTAVVAYMVALALEAVAVARGRERELDWVS